MNAQDIKAAYAKYKSRRITAEKLGITESAVRRAMGYRSGGKHAPKAVFTVPALKTKKTLADFRMLYDKSTIIPAKIKQALKALGAGGWELESEFARSAGVTLGDLGNFRDQFADFIVPIERGARRVWAGSAKVAEQMKGMVS